MRYPACAVALIHTNSIRYERSDISACIPREKQAPSVSLHSGTGVVPRFSPQQVWLVVEKPRNRMSFRAQTTCLNSIGCSKMYPFKIISLSVTLQLTISVTSLQRGLLLIRRCLSQLRTVVRHEGAVPLGLPDAPSLLGLLEFSTSKIETIKSTEAETPTLQWP